jgi:hypothetical protein
MKRGIVIIIIIQGIHKRMVQFQKLTRSLFLTSHGHNVHRQQQQLSTFLMRYQQFASLAYCRAAGPVSKMASQQEKAFCVFRFEGSRSVITVQGEFRARFRTAGSAKLNLSAQRWWRDFLLGILLLEPWISLMYAWKANKYTNYSFSLLIMYGNSCMFRHYIAIFRDRS